MRLLRVLTEDVGYMDPGVRELRITGEAKASSFQHNTITSADQRYLEAQTY